MKLAMIVLASLCVPHVAFAKGPADDLAKLVDAQIAAWSKGTADGADGASLYTRTASFVVTGGATSEDVPAVEADRLAATLISAIWIDTSKLTNRVVTLARDGKSGWISFELYMKVDRTEDGVASFPEHQSRRAPSQR